MTGAPRIGTRWRLWDQFAVRGPGFPATGVLRLAPDGLAAAADEFTPGEPLRGARWTEFTRLYQDAAVRTAHRLQDIARDPAFRQAVAWQNPTVLRTGITPFLNWTPSAAGRTSMPRQREELVAHYWQRFCVKNDTIGFFGPVGWGHFDDRADALEVDPGRGLIEARELYFATWAVDALAARISADPRLRDRIAPRRLPFVRVDGVTVTVPGRPAQTVDPVTAEVLGRCDGVREAAAVRAELPDADVTAILTDLQKRRWVSWRLELPADARPERFLRSWLETVDDPDAWAAFTALERGRDRVRQADGDEELIAAMNALQVEFTARTETAAVREKSAGTAPCRALVYADTRRSATTRAGAAVRAALAPLDPLLTSAGWLTARLAALVLERARDVYADLARHGPVDLASFWFACMPILHGDARTGAADLQREFTEIWHKILAPPAGVSRVRHTGADLAAAVAEHFGAGGSGWTTARYLSPDMMIAARDLAAVRRGDFELVLGELHLAANTLGSSLFVNQHPDPAELFALTDRDHPGPRLLPLLPKEHRSRLSIRTRQVLIRPQDHQVALADLTADPARPRTVRSADVRVSDHDGDLVAIMPDGVRHPIADVFSHVLTTLAMDLFRLLPEAPHTPRVTVDRMVVARETWRTPAGAFDFAGEHDEPARFVRARQWRLARGLPRFVFAALPTEPRPFYTDFDSPVSVTVLAKAVRRLARADDEGTVTLTEMLPTPEQAWLPDDQGRTYTSELRFVVVDEG